MSEWYDNQPTDEEMDKMCCYPDVHKNRKKELTEFYLDELDHIRGVAKRLLMDSKIYPNQQLTLQDRIDNGVRLIKEIVERIQQKEEE
jgi:hypothetical protein